MQKKNNGKVRRLIQCIKHLGLKNGYRYWKLQNKAMKDPFVVPKLCEKLREEAMVEDSNGNYLAGALMRSFAKEAENLNTNFHAAKNNGHGFTNAEPTITITITEYRDLCRTAETLDWLQSQGVCWRDVDSVFQDWRVGGETEWHYNNAGDVRDKVEEHRKIIARNQTCSQSSSHPANCSH